MSVIEFIGYAFIGTVIGQVLRPIIAPIGYAIIYPFIWFIFSPYLIADRIQQERRQREKEIAQEEWVRHVQPTDWRGIVALAQTFLPLPR